MEFIMSVKFELSEQQKSSFIAIGATIGESENDRKQALKSFCDLVYIDYKVSYDLWEAGRLAFCSGYSQAKKIQMFDSNGKLNNAVKQAWHRFSLDLENEHAITKPQKTDNIDSVKKAESRSKASEEKEQLMSLSYDTLEQQANDLRIKGGKEHMKQAVKILDVIEAKKKAEEKAIKSEFSEKHKLIKQLVVNCNNHTDLDSIIELLQDYQPLSTPSIV